MGIAAGNRQHLFSHVFGQAVGKGGGVGYQYLGHAGNLRCGLSGSGAIVAGHQDMQIAAASGSGGDGVKRASL